MDCVPHINTCRVSANIYIDMRDLWYVVFRSKHMQWSRDISTFAVVAKDSEAKICDVLAIRLNKCGSVNLQMC